MEPSSSSTQSSSHGPGLLVLGRILELSRLLEPNRLLELSRLMVLSRLLELRRLLELGQLQELNLLWVPRLPGSLLLLGWTIHLAGFASRHHSSQFAT